MDENAIISDKPTEEVLENNNDVIQNPKDEILNDIKLNIFNISPNNNSFDLANNVIDLVKNIGKLTEHVITEKMELFSEEMTVGIDKMSLEMPGFFNKIEANIEDLMGKIGIFDVFENNQFQHLTNEISVLITDFSDRSLERAGLNNAEFSMWQKEINSSVLEQLENGDIDSIKEVLNSIIERNELKPHVVEKAEEMIQKLDELPELLAQEHKEQEVENLGVEVSENEITKENVLEQLAENESVADLLNTFQLDDLLSVATNVEQNNDDMTVDNQVINTISLEFEVNERLKSEIVVEEIGGEVHISAYDQNASFKLDDISISQEQFASLMQNPPEPLIVSPYDELATKIEDIQADYSAIEFDKEQVIDILENGKDMGSLLDAIQTISEDVNYEFQDVAQDLLEEVGGFQDLSIEVSEDKITKENVLEHLAENESVADLLNTFQLDDLLNVATNIEQNKDDMTVDNQVINTISLEFEVNERLKSEIVVEEIGGEVHISAYDQNASFKLDDMSISQERFASLMQNPPEPLIVSPYDELATKIEDIQADYSAIEFDKEQVIDILENGKDMGSLLDAIQTISEDVNYEFQDVAQDLLEEVGGFQDLSKENGLEQLAENESVAKLYDLEEKLANLDVVNFGISTNEMQELAESIKETNFPVFLITEDLLKREDFVLILAKELDSPDCIEYAQSKLLNDPDFIKQAVDEIGVEVLEYASKELLNDPDFMNDMIQEHNSAVAYLDDLGLNQEFVLDVLNFSPEIINDVNENLLHTPSFLDEVEKHHPQAYDILNAHAVEQFEVQSLTNDDLKHLEQGLELEKPTKEQAKQEKEKPNLNAVLDSFSKKSKEQDTLDDTAPIKIKDREDR